MGSLRLHRQHLRRHGCLRRPRWASVASSSSRKARSPGASSRSRWTTAPSTIQLKTDFDGCVKILGELVQKFPIYLLNSVNPYRLEGQKTPAFEMVEQLDWQVPEHIVVPGGNLANSAALAKGFSEMFQLGLIPRRPKISIIQAEGANPLYRWFIDSNRIMKPVTADTRVPPPSASATQPPGAKPPQPSTS